MDLSRLSLKEHSSFLLRTASSSIKFLFIIYLSSFHSSSLVGQYAILSTIIAIAVQFIGFELSTIVGREIHKKHIENKLSILRVQYVFYIAVYLLSIPVVFYVFERYFNFPPWVGIVFCFVVLMEHFFTEVFRTLVSLVRVNEATWIQFLKSVPYIIYLIFSFEFFNNSPSLEYIIFCWFFNLVICLFYFLFSYRGYIFSNVKAYFRLSLIFDGLDLARKSTPFFAISILGVLFSQFDKLLIGKELGVDDLGQYFTLFTITSILTLFISLTVGVRQGPNAIKTFSKFGIKSYVETRKILIKSYIVYIFLGLLAVSLIGVTYLYLNESLMQHTYTVTFFLLLLSTALLALGQVYRVDLYLLGKDKVLFLIYLVSFSINVVLLLILLPILGVIGAALSVLISVIVNLIGKVFFSNRYMKMAMSGI